MNNNNNNNYLNSKVLLLVFSFLFIVNVQADRASKVEALRPLKGLCYVPYTSDWSSNHGNDQKYFDTDYTNSCFPLLWGTANNGRGDIKTFHELGVNFLRLYDWSAPPNPPGGDLSLNERNHLPFLDECHTYGIKVTIPFSNYNVFNIKNTSFTWIKPNIQAMVEEAYNGGTKPHPAAAMLAVGNEIFLNAGKNNVSNDQAAQYAIEVVEIILQQEDAMGIADEDKLLITLPISTSTLGETDPVGGAYGLGLIKQYAEASAICTSHNFLTERYIISLNVEMNGQGSRTYLGQIKEKFPDTPVVFTEFGTDRDNVASELQAVISSQKPFQYFDDTLLGVSIFTWVGEPGQSYTFPIAQVAVNPEGQTGTILPQNYNPGGGEEYPVDKIKLFPAFSDIQKIYSSKETMTVSSGSIFTVSMPAVTAVESARLSDRRNVENSDYDFLKKPRIFVQDENGKKYRAKIITKKFPSDELKCKWIRRLSPGVYSLYIDIDKTPHLITDNFEVSAPVIDEVLHSNDGQDTVIELRGNYFGKRPKVYYTFKDQNDKKRTLKCKIIESDQSTEGETGYGVLKAKYPSKVLKRFQNGEILINPQDDESYSFQSWNKAFLPLGFTVKNRIGHSTSNPVPGSILANNTDTIWFVDKQKVSGKSYYNFLFRGSQPLTSETSVNEQTFDLETLVSMMKQRYDEQKNSGDPVSFPTNFKIIDVSLIGFAGSVHDGIGEAPYLFREFVSFGGDSSAGDITFILPGEYQPADSWYKFPYPPGGYSISGKLLWQPVGGIIPSTSTPSQFPSNIKGSVTDNKAFAKEKIFDLAWSRPAFTYIPKTDPPKTFPANKFYDVMDNIIAEMAKDNGEATIIYVHCMHGHDRTSSVVTSYLLNQTDYKNKHISDAVDEKYVPGTALMDHYWPHKDGLSKGKVLKYPYGILAEWYYIYLYGAYSAIPKQNQEGTWQKAPSPESDEVFDYAVGW